MPDEATTLAERLTKLGAELYIDGTPEAFAGEIRNLRERWVCTEDGCERTPDGGKSGDIYVTVCHSCGKCMMHATTLCSVCGDAVSRQERMRDLERLVEVATGCASDYERGVPKERVDEQARTCDKVARAMGLNPRVTFSG